MNILVYDVAADNGGAVTILDHYYNTHKDDLENHYYYLLSTYKLDNTINSTVINIPSIKKSWMHRIVFDCLGSKKFLKQYRIDRVYSLQNTLLPAFKGPQTVYIHNALPFSEYRFSISEDLKMWVYQNIIGRLIIWSIKKADKVIVQTDWMRDAISHKCKVNDKIEVSFPKVVIPEGLSYKEQSKPCFFYPANGAPFKNHRIIIDACKQLSESGIKDYEVVFTLLGNENDSIARLKEEADKAQLPIKWIGTISREEVIKWYEKSILLFPSFIETIGLPIYEAMQVGSPVVVTNCEYSRSLTKDYRKKMSFDYNDANELSSILIAFCSY